MSEMVERVARAIHEKFEHQVDSKICAELARVAIEAMREPTDAMLAMAETDYGAWHCWHLMIDESLGRNGLIKGEVNYRPIDEALK